MFSIPKTLKQQYKKAGSTTLMHSIHFALARANIKKYIDEWLPEEYEKCLVGLTAITKEAWDTAANTEDKREKIQALSLAKECYSVKLDLLTNATVVDDAIRFVSQKSKENLKSYSGNTDGDDKGSNESDYDEELEKQEEEREEETGERFQPLT
jgi:hypothetical protein